MNLAPVIGVWHNTKDETAGITKGELTERDGQVWMRVWAVDPEGGKPEDWGEAPVERLYHTAPEGGRVCGLTVTFERGDTRTRIFVNMNHGVSVFGALTTFTDGSGRPDRLLREFFHRRG